ncbi:hypothetical protein ACFX2B_029638 [Malus domestica]
MKLVAATRVPRAQEAVINGRTFAKTLVETKFVLLVKSKPIIHTLLPLSSKGEVVDVYGNSVDAMEDEFFRLTTKEGKLSVEGRV